MTAINQTTPASMPVQPANQGINVPVGTNPGTLVPGVSVTSQGGTTTLPNASVEEYAGETNPGDAPDKQYPSLTVAHVLVFRAMNTPEEVIAQLAAEQPDKAFVEDYVLNQIIPNPEGWDAHVGNPAGTARSGLAQAFPGAFGDPAAQQSSSTQTPDGGTTVTSTGGAEFAPVPVGGMSTTTKLVLGGLGVAGLGFAGYKFMNRNKDKASQAEAGAAQMSELLTKMRGGGMDAAVVGGGDAVKPSLASTILQLDSGTGGLGALRQFANGGTDAAASGAEHIMSQQLAALSGGAERAAGAFHPVGLPVADWVPMAEVATKYGQPVMDVWKLGIINNSAGALSSNDLGKLLTSLVPGGKSVPAAHVVEELGVDIAKAITKVL